jgi:hypothetical protein
MNMTVTVKHVSAFEFGRGVALGSDARGLNKKTIATEAIRQLEMMRQMFQEDNWNGNQVKYHANSGNNYLASVKAAGLDIPEWVSRNAGFLRAQGWRW